MGKLLVDHYSNVFKCLKLLFMIKNMLIIKRKKKSLNTSATSLNNRH